MRDNFDMHALLQRENFSYADVVEAFKVYRPYTDLKIPYNRLRSSDYSLTDPGLSGLIDEDEEDTMERIQEYFIKLLDLESS